MRRGLVQIKSYKYKLCRYQSVIYLNMNERYLPRFSITTLLLVTALISFAVSHFLVSRKLADTKAALTALRNDALVLDADDSSLIHVIALPTYGPLQWRWKMQLPTEGEYRLRYSIEQIPETGLPSQSTVIADVFHDSNLEPLPGGIPFNLRVAFFKDGNGVWHFTASNGDRGAFNRIDIPPPWLESTTMGGWGSSIAGGDSTTSSSADGPLLLVTKRKLRTDPGSGVSIVDKSPTDGLAVWVERID